MRLRLIGMPFCSLRRLAGGPAAEGQAQALRVDQRGGDDLGALLDGVGVRSARVGAIIEASESLLVEAMDPGVDRGPRGTEHFGDLAGPPIGDG